MKKKEQQEYIGRSTDEIKRIIAENQKKLANLRFDIPMHKVKNVREMKNIKKNIAQLLTILREREIKEDKTKS